MEEKNNSNRKYTPATQWTWRLAFTPGYFHRYKLSEDQQRLEADAEEEEEWEEGRRRGRKAGWRD